MLEEDRGLKEKQEGPSCARIVFPKSAGATQNVILASVLHKGTTILKIVPANRSAVAVPVFKKKVEQK